MVVTPLTPYRHDINLRLVLGQPGDAVTETDGKRQEGQEGGVGQEAAAGCGPAAMSSASGASGPAGHEPRGNGSESGSGGNPAEVVLLPVVRGQGSFGRVVEGTYRGRRVAVKLTAERLLPGNPGCESMLRSFSHEVAVLGRCDHPHVVRLLAACMSPPRLCLVMELMDTSLEAMIRNAPDHLLPLDTVSGGGGSGAGIKRRTESREALDVEAEEEAEESHPFDTYDLILIRRARVGPMCRTHLQPITNELRVKLPHPQTPTTPKPTRPPNRLRPNTLPACAYGTPSYAPRAHLALRRRDFHPLLAPRRRRAASRVCVLLALCLTCSLIPG